MANNTDVPPDQWLIGTGEVAARLNCHIISVYRFLRAKPDFPQPRRLANKLAWREAEIQKWIKAQPLRQRHSDAA